MTTPVKKWKFRPMTTSHQVKTRRRLEMAWATPCLPPSAQFNTTLLIHESTHFLPPRRSGRAHARVAEDDPVSAAVVVLADAILRSQQPTGAVDCEVRGVRLSLVEDEVEGEFEKTLSSLVKPMLHCLLHDRVPLGAQPGPPRGGRAYHFRYLESPFRPLVVFQNQSKCESRSLECFLEPLSQCPDDQRLRLPARMLGDRFPDVAKFDKIYRSAPLAALPLIQQAQVAGQFNTVALLISRILRPSAAVAASVAQAKRELGWPEPSEQRRRAPLLIGLHLSCTAAERMKQPDQACDPVQAYLPAIRELERAYGADRQVYVYLATNDEAAVAAAGRIRAETAARRKAGAAGAAGLHAIWLSRPGPVGRSRAKLAGEQGGNEDGWLAGGAGPMDGHDHAMHRMVDMILLSQCDAMVSKFSSDASRIAYALMAARRGAELSRRTAELDAAHPVDSPPAGERGVSSSTVFGRNEPTMRPRGLAEPGQGGLAGFPPADAGPRLCLPPFISLQKPWCAGTSADEPQPAYEGMVARPALREFGHAQHEGGVWCQ
jgi:hypothetical protein